MDSYPPFHDTYKTLINNSIKESKTRSPENDNDLIGVEECDLPMIDLSLLNPGVAGETDRIEECKSEIAKASKEWGFFQVVNHGVCQEILERVRIEQVDLFKQPFDKKSKEVDFLNFGAGSYRWGTPTATCLKQLSWSEAFHIPLTDISSASRGFNNFRSTMEEFAIKVSDLAQSLAEILAEKLGQNSKFFRENCLPNTCYLRMNRYLPCPIFSKIYGLMPHTDSDFLTILHQDQVGGLQLVKDGKWIAVKPIPDALIINIGDLFQAWSNNVYKSVEHRVVANPHLERFSIAYFFCPSFDTVIQSCEKPSVYRNFSFREYRQQVQEDVKNLGIKIGLPRFLV